MPLDGMVEGETEKVFERIKKERGQLDDFLLHSIAFSPKGTLHGCVVDVDREGFQRPWTYPAGRSCEWPSWRSRWFTIHARRRGSPSSTN